MTEAGGAVADLSFSKGLKLSAGNFALSPDGNGGTDITLVAAAAATDLWAVRGAS